MMRKPGFLMRLRGGWYRRACDSARAEKLREQSPGYVIASTPDGWNAVHQLSGTVLGPVRTPGRLAAEIDLDRWGRSVRTAAGVPIRIRAGGAS